MRSGGGVSTLTNNGPMAGIGAGMGSGDGAGMGSSLSNISSGPTGLSGSGANSGGNKKDNNAALKKAQTVPIFLKKTYKMIDTCDPSIASWTPDGEMFVVKDPDLFASQIIPQYFDHNKFSSFARQLNFYGFRKMQSKPIRNADFNVDTAKHVTFYNEKFKRGRCDLLVEIQRTTRGGGASHTTNEDQVRQITDLKKQVATLQTKVDSLNKNFDDRVRRLELDMLSKMEQIMLAMQQQHQQQHSHAQILDSISHIANLNAGGTGTGAASGAAGGIAGNAASVNHPNPAAATQVAQLQQAIAAAAQAQAAAGKVPTPISSNSTIQVNNGAGGGGRPRGDSIVDLSNPKWNPLPYEPHKNNNTNDTSNNKKQQSQPTLPPHPKQKIPASLPPHPKQKQAPMSGSNGPIPASGFPNGLNAPPQRFDSLRGISLGISRGFSVESAASSVLLNNLWDMLGDDTAAANKAMAAAAPSGGTPMELDLGGSNKLRHGTQQNSSTGSLSSVSSGEED